jgi:hypothetical protein
VSLAEVLGEMNNALPVSKALPFSDLTAFRKKRNAVAHFGFSKRDDEESLRLLLSVAIPLLDSWVEQSLGLKLVGALYGDLGERVRLAVNLSPRPKQSPVSVRLRTAAALAPPHRLCKCFCALCASASGEGGSCQ